VRPVGLVHEVEPQRPFMSTEGEARRMSVSRWAVARFLAEAAESPANVGQAVALSAY
jgi:hypothetical protein